MNKEKFMLALILAIGIIFNLRSGMVDKCNEDHLQTENLILYNDNYINLAFIGNSGTICNKRERLSPNFHNCIISILAARKKNGIH